jgi:hypothetical protein
MSNATCVGPVGVPQTPAPAIPKAPAATTFRSEVAAELRRIYAHLVFFR